MEQSRHLLKLMNTPKNGKTFSDISPISNDGGGRHAKSKETFDKISDISGIMSYGHLEHFKKENETIHESLYRDGNLREIKKKLYDKG